MPSLNCILLLGPLTRPPASYQTARNTPVTSFDLLVDVPAREKVSVIRVVVCGKQAEPEARYLGRGSLVFIAGHLRQREMVSREGEKHRALEVAAERIEFLSEPVGLAKEIACTRIDACDWRPSISSPSRPSTLLMAFSLAPSFASSACKGGSSEQRPERECGEEGEGPQPRDGAAPLPTMAYVAARARWG